MGEDSVVRPLLLFTGQFEAALDFIRSSGRAAAYAGRPYQAAASVRQHG